MNIYELRQRERMLKKIDRFKEITSQMADLYAKKNRNYGDSFGKLYSDLGPISGLVPLHNKLDRATNLLKGDKNHFESIKDTLIDLANYSIMLYIELENDPDFVDEVDKRPEGMDVMMGRKPLPQGWSPADVWQKTRGSDNQFDEEEVEYSGEH
jgi:hypothetical protein